MLFKFYQTAIIIYLPTIKRKHGLVVKYITVLNKEKNYNEQCYEAQTNKC